MCYPLFLILAFRYISIRTYITLINKVVFSLNCFYESGEKLGSKDIVCFHYGYWPKDESLSNNKKDVFKPYIGYIDENGKYIDTMFDAVMFLILQGACPSGGKLTADGMPSVMSDWKYLIDNTFAQNINFDALDEATAELKEQLSLPDTHKTAVYLSVPYPKISDIVFGDFDGDEIDNQILTLEDCVSVYTWYVDKVIERYNEKDYQNIELKGFLWSNESLSTEYYEQELDLAKLCVEELHKRQMQCIFVSFYQAVGIEKAEEIGFDSTIMQINKALQDNAEKMMDDFAYIAAKYHTGIKMDIHHSLLYDINAYGSLYNQYLVFSVKNGMMTDTVHTYYQGAGYGVFYKCAYSIDARARWFYDATYKFIKGTLYFPELKINVTITGNVIQNEKFKGIFDIDGDWSNSEYKLSVLQQPKYGILRVDVRKGEYYYRPYRKYVGEDCFVLKYNNKNGKTIEVPVKITVTPKETHSIVFDTSTMTDNKNSSKKILNKGWLYGIIGGVAAAAVALSVIFITNNKNK